MEVSDLALYQELKRIGKPYIVGSFVLTQVFDVDFKVKDIDICIDTDKSTPDIINFIIAKGAKIIRKTKVGGIKIMHQNIVYDIWRLKDTVINWWEKDYYCHDSFLAVMHRLPVNSQHCWISPEDDAVYYLESFEDFMYGDIVVTNKLAFNSIDLFDKSLDNARTIKALFEQKTANK